MYGSEVFFLIAGIVLLIINVAIVVKFFQIARNIERLTNLYVDGVKENDNEHKYYKLPLEEDLEQTEKFNEERKRYQENLKTIHVHYR